MLFVLLCSFIPLSRLRKKLKYISEENIKVGSKVYTYYNETCSGNRVISAYNLEEPQEDKFNSALKNTFHLGIKSTQISGWLTPIMYFIASIGIAIVMGYGTYLIVSGSIKSGTLVSFITALILLYNPIKSIGSTVVATQNSFFAIGRILELLDYDPKIKDKPDAVRLKSVKNSIEFKNVWFEYEKDKPVLKNINLEVKMGETLALVGKLRRRKVNAGNLLPRFYDISSGNIKFDGIDIKDVKIDSLREKIAVVFQDNFLFDATIRENILLGKADATRQELNEAVKNAYLEDFINTLEDGLDTRIRGKRNTPFRRTKAKSSYSQSFNKKCSHYYTG